MGRFIRQVQTALPPQQAVAVINNFYAANGFSQYNYNNELWFKKGGVFLGPRVMRALVYGNTIIIEGFVRYAILPGVYVGEIGDDGFVGAIPQSKLKKNIADLTAQLGSANIGGYAQQNVQYRQAVEIPHMFCPACGNAVDGGSVFCPNCGNKLR